MTTAHSPLSQLKAQADKIAALLAAAERGEKIDVRFAEKIAAARGKESVIFAVVMDDKILKIEMPWARIRETSEAGISEFILSQMRSLRETIQ
jgi:predicted GTPase